jgi:hypothetical protein
MFHLFDKRIYPVLKNFPISERNGLAQEIKQDFLAYLRYVHRADKVKSKRLTYAQEAEGFLLQIKMEMKLAVNKRYISKAFYEDVSLELTEVSKMLRGFIKSTTKK